MRQRQKTQADKKAQAILELAIFGSILIMLLGVLINYGLKYNFQQQVQQQTFRKALGLNERSASYVLLKDNHIPNPADPFAIGSVAPAMSSASVVRDFQMHETPDPDHPEELPHVYIETPDGQVRAYKTAAFRDEINVPNAELDTDYDADGNGYIDEYEKDVSKYGYVYGSENSGWWKIGGGGFGTSNIRIIDSCAAEIMSYDQVYVRCAQIDQTGINEPWYCERRTDEKTGEFALLPKRELFPKMEKSNMGLQQDYTQVATMDNTLSKTESASAITTTDNLNWGVHTTRRIVYYDGVDESGFSKGWAPEYIIGDEEAEGKFTSTVGQNKTYDPRETPF